MNNYIIEKIIKKSAFSNWQYKNFIFTPLNQYYNENRIKLTKIGHVKDINSQHKNEFFEEIFKDEDEIIVDIRLFEEEPSQKELEEMTEYWSALQLHFKKRVQPIFIMMG